MTMLAINWGNALIITVVGFSLVFTMLVLLIGVIKIFGLVFAEKPQKQSVATVAAAAPVESDEEEMAAIAFALHMFYDMHDEESDVLTIVHEDAAYSPWNQKSITF